MTIQTDHAASPGQTAAQAVLAEEGGVCRLRGDQDCGHIHLNVHSQVPGVVGSCAVLLRSFFLGPVRHIHLAKLDSNPRVTYQISCVLWVQVVDCDLAEALFRFSYHISYAHIKLLLAFGQTFMWSRWIFFSLLILRYLLYQISPFCFNWTRFLAAMDLRELLKIVSSRRKPLQSFKFGVVSNNPFQEYHHWTRM